MSEAAIKATHVRKTYRNYKSNLQKLRHMLMLSTTGEKINVFSDVSFEIKKGERAAIITDSGFGKTTMMRLLAGIITPEKGSIEVNGKLTSVLDYKCGFDNALTVADNYEIACTLYGWPEDVIKQREEEVLKFAGLSDMRDEPLSACKSIGANKLGFAIVTCDKPDILLFDGRFSFGSKKTNAKYINHLMELISDPDVTFVMSANKTNIAEKFCTRGIVIIDGKVGFDGDYKEALAFYKENSSVKTKKTPAVIMEEPKDPEENAADEADEISGEDGSGLD